MSDMSLPPNVADMIRDLRDKSAPRFQRDNVASVLENIVEKASVALRTYNRETGRADRR